MKINFDNYKIKWKDRSGFKKLCLWYDLSQKTMIYSKLTSNSQRCEICSNKDSRITSNVFLVKEDLLKNSMWTYTVTISRVNPWEILAKEFTSEVNPGYNDAGYIQISLMWICLFTDFAHWKAN